MKHLQVKKKKSENPFNLLLDLSAEKRNQIESDKKIKEKELVYQEFQAMYEKQNAELEIEIKKKEKALSKLYKGESEGYNKNLYNNQFRFEKQKTQNYDSKLKNIFENLMISVIINIEGKEGGTERRINWKIRVN
jgi:hypothetical protein